MLNNIQFGLTITTAYLGTSGKIKATIKHGADEKDSVTMSYEHSLNSTDNHYSAANKLIHKMMDQHNKHFEVIAYSYNEKDTGYNFIVKRVN